jgi:hypothetical protein
VAELTNEDHAIRLAAAKSLGQLGWKPTNAREKAYIAVAQGKYSMAVKLGVAAVEPLLDSVRERWGGDDDVVEALGQIGIPAIEALDAALKDEDAEVELTAVRALGKIKDCRIIKPLIRAIQDSYWRDKAIAPLVASQDPSALEALIDTSIDLIEQGVEYFAQEVINAMATADDQTGVQRILDALKLADIQRDIELLEKGMASLKENYEEHNRGLIELVEKMASVLGTPEKAEHIPADLLTQLRELSDAKDAEWEVSTDPHDSYFSVDYWVPIPVDCSKIRDLADQELNRRK